MAKKIHVILFLILLCTGCELSQNAAISPTTATFDKSTANQADIVVTMTLNGNTLVAISDGSGELAAGSDYELADETVTINKSYLANQAVGSLELTFDFDEGQDRVLTVTVSDTTDDDDATDDAAISPTTATFDKNTANQADIVVTMTLNGNTLEAIKNGSSELEAGSDYELADEMVTINKSYLADQAVGTLELNFDFSAGNDPVLTVTVSDTTDDAIQGMFRVNDAGVITKNGAELPIQCGAWFGLEGQHEPPDAEYNPGGAPLELYVGNMWWNPTGRTIQQTMTEIKAQGFNVIRLPITPQTLDPTDPQGIGWVREGGVLKNDPSVQQENARQALEDFIILADKNDIDLIIDIHSCSNYVGWRAGRLDAKPPYVDADREGYVYTREDHSCSATDNPSSVTTVAAYNQSLWLENLREIAALPALLDVDNIMAIDIFNEPWDYTWSEWKSLAESAYQAITEVNDDVLIVVEGIGSELADGTTIPHGDGASNPNWGENFYPAAAAPLDIPKERLVLSPHTYGPSVFVQRQFMDPSQPECSGLEGNEAGDADCNILIDAETLEAGWEEHFGYLRDQGYAMIIGEFGGNMAWPEGASQAEQTRWSHISPGVDAQWQNALVDYAIKHDINACYWSINPESADTGGLYGTTYVPDTNESGWGTWTDIDTDKMELLKRLWD